MELLINDKRTIVFFLIHFIAVALMMFLEAYFIDLEKYWYISVISIFGFLLITGVNLYLYLTFIFPRKYIIDLKEEK